jgi:NADH:ubiquinone oxidoreductase subunit 2 (subunit N)
MTPRVRRVLEGLAGTAHLVLGAALLLVGANALLGLGAPPRLDPTGAWLDDGWARAARGALLAATGIAALGLVRVSPFRRLAALGLLLVAALGLAVSAGALDLVALWAGCALATTVAPLALVIGDARRSAARHALATLLLGGLACGILAAAFLALAALAGSTHLVDIGFLVTRHADASPLALTAVRATVVGAAILAAWAPFHLAAPELWGEGSAPLAGWLAIAWPWAGFTLLVRLSSGLVPALEEWSFDAAAAASLFLVLGALVPALAALAERRAGRMLALLSIGTLSELLLGVRAAGADGGAIAGGLLGYGLAWVATAAALAGVRARTAPLPAGAPPPDHLDALAGLAARRPRTALALALGALLWAGLPGTFSLVVRGTLWQTADAPAGLVLLVVAGGGFLRVLAVARLVGVLYFRAPESAAAGAGAGTAGAAGAAGQEVAAGEPVPGALALGVHWRWGLAFVAALGLEFGLGLFAPDVAGWLRSVAGAVAAG